MAVPPLYFRVPEVVRIVMICFAALLFSLCCYGRIIGHISD